MLKAAIKSLFAHRTRLALTALSVVLGVAFISGTFIYTDTTNDAFDGVFADAFDGIDIIVTGDSEFTFGEALYFDDSLVDDVAAVPGVAEIEPSLQGIGVQIIDKEGNPVGGGGPPQFGAYLPERIDAAGGFTLREGRVATGGGEVTIDAATARETGYVIGDTVPIVSPTAPVTEFELVGIVGFGDQDNIAGATFALFNLQTIGELLGHEGQVDGAYVLTDPGVDIDATVLAIDDILPDNAKAQSAQAASEEQAAAIQEGLSFFSTFLLVFAFIALFVGSFIIYNTFRIVIAQRLRELALMRAIGSTRAQVVRTVLLEAVIIGVVASAVGVLFGLGLAMLLRFGLEAAGLDLPSGTLVLAPRTVIVGMIVGVIVTTLSALFPAIAASRIPPVAAMRAEAATPRRRSLTVRAIVGGAITLAGVAMLLAGLNGDYDSASVGLSLVGTGAAVIIIGAYILSALIARPIATVVGAPFARLMGVSGKLAQRNAGRSPRRTSSTAAALMVGIALITLVSILSASIQDTIDDIFDTGIEADVVVTSTDQFSLGGFTTELGDRIEALPEVDDVTRVQTGAVLVDGSEQFIGSTETNAEAFFTFDSLDGTLDLGDDEVAIDAATAEANGQEIGDVIDMTFQLTGDQTFTIATIYEADALAGYVVSRTEYEENFSANTDSEIFVQVVDGVTPEEGKEAVEAVAGDVPTANVETKEETIDSISAQINQVITLITGLLGLTVFIALIGVLNTMSLAVYERTREIGLLRAVGLDRKQTRRMIRSEASIISTFGALLGVGLGIFFGWAVLQALEAEGFSGFSIPYVTLVIWVVLVTGLGILAAIYPAWRASRLNVLDAISHD